jgi:hypothetical protein
MRFVIRGVILSELHPLSLCLFMMPQGNEEWAEEAMLRDWSAHANCEGGKARSRVKVDRP